MGSLISGHLDSSPLVTTLIFNQTAYVDLAVFYQIMYLVIREKTGHWFTRSIRYELNLFSIMFFRCEKSTVWWQCSKPCTLEFLNKHGATFINFCIFSRVYPLIRRGTILNFEPTFLNTVPVPLNGALSFWGRPPKNSCWKWFFMSFLCDNLRGQKIISCAIYWRGYGTYFNK